MAQDLSVTDASGVNQTLHKVDGSVVEPLLTALLASPSLATNGFGANTKFVAKASAGKIRALRVTNANAAVRYLQVHNVTAVPAGATVPTAHSYLIPAGTATNPGVLHLDQSFFGDGGASFATGITITISSTLGTFTDGATASEHLAHVHYV